VLQYPEMIIHPPNLYSGYTGFTIPFAFCLGGVGWRDIPAKVDSPDAQVDDDRVCFQNCRHLLGRIGLCSARMGTATGAGIRGECVLPAVADGTAFLHSVMMQKSAACEGLERLAGVHLRSCVHFGTMLTRSGVVSSVHAFAQSNIGSWFVGFLLVVIAVCLVAYSRTGLPSRAKTSSIRWFRGIELPL